MINNFLPVLQVSPSGVPIRWITYKRYMCYKMKGSIAWELYPNSFFIHSPSNRATTKLIKHGVSLIVATKVTKTRKKLSFEKVPTISNSLLFKRDRFVCAYCEGVQKFSKLSRDHIYPTSRGGENTWMNVITACHWCNKDKGDKLLSKSQWELGFKPYVPNYAESLLYSRRRATKEQLEYLLQYIPDTSRARLVI